MYNSQLTRQYMQFIQQAGFKYFKDAIGYYFDNGTKIFSIMQCGPVFNCFYNIKIDGAWVLKLKKPSVLSFEESLKWILYCIQKGI